MLFWINFWITMSWTDLNPTTENAEDLDLKSFRFRLQTSDFPGEPCLKGSHFRLQTSNFPGESFLKGFHIRLQAFLGSLV